MQVQRYVVKMQKKDDIFHLMPLGDIHWGNPAHDREEFNRHVTKILDNPNYLTLGIGDYVENNSVIARNQISKAFDPEAMGVSKTPQVSQEVREFREAWKPLVPRTVGLHVGNHEDRTIGHDMFRLLFTEPLGVNYLGDFALTVLTFAYKGHVVYEPIIVSAHGSKFGGQTPETVIGAARRKFMNYDFDLALFGHTHYASVMKLKTGFVDLAGEAPRYAERKRFICNTGSFLKSHIEDFDAYTDKAFGSLRDVGTISVTFEPEGRKMFAHA